MRILAVIYLIGLVVGFPPIPNLSSFRHWITSIAHRSGQSLADVFLNGFVRYEDMIIQKGSSGIVSLETSTRMKSISAEIQGQVAELATHSQEKTLTTTRYIPTELRQQWPKELYMSLHDLGMHRNFINLLTGDLSQLCGSHHIRCGGFVFFQDKNTYISDTPGLRSLLWRFHSLPINPRKSFHRDYSKKHRFLPNKLL